MSVWTRADNSSVRQHPCQVIQQRIDDGMLMLRNRYPSRNEALIMAVIHGRSTSTNSFDRKVGIGSSGHDFVGDCMICLRPSAVLHCKDTDTITCSCCTNIIDSPVDVRPPGAAIPSGKSISIAEIPLAAMAVGLQPYSER